MYVRLLTNNFLSEKAVGKSESKDVHLAVLRVLPEVIRESVDADASSKSVIIYDPATGEKKMVSPTAVDGIESLGEVKTAEQTEAEINARMQDTIQRSKDWLEGNVANPVGMQIQLGDGRIATIEAMHEDGKSAIATLPDGTQFMVPKDVLQRIVNNGQYADYKARRDAEASKREAEQGTESAPETVTEGGQPLPEEASPKEDERREYAQGDVFDVVVDGQKMHAEIVSPKDADGRFVVNVDDGESMRTLYVTPEELAAMEYKEHKEEPLTESENPRTIDTEEPPISNAAPTEHTPTALERIPRDEKGNAQFHDVDTETAWDGLVEMSGNEETAHKVAEASLANAERKLKAAKALKEKGETPEELLRSIKENEAAVAEAQRTVDAWKAIVGEKSRREEAAKAESERIATEKAEAERKAAEERERAEAEEKTRIEAEKKETERIAAEKAEEEARVEAERKAEEERKDAEEVAGALGYRVEWVDTMEENGTIDADKKVIRIAKDAENPLVQVLGHEVAHGVKRMDGGKFKALQKAAMEVAGEKEWNERIEKKRKLNAYAEGKLAEEVTCDIVGEALNNNDALKRLAESLRGEKGILARLRDAVAKMVEYFKNRGDKEGVRRMKAADKLLAEFESALKEGANERRLSPDTPIRLVNADADHGFKNYEEARAWAKENIARTYGNDETGGKGEIRISNTAIGKFLSEKAVGKSESKDVHLAVLRVLPDVIRESVDAEQHADYRKGADGRRGGNGVNPDVTMHILYGAVTIDGKTYRVKTTLKENVRDNEPTKAYTYEATKIELLAGPNEKATVSTFSRDSNNSITAAKLLKDVKKSYSNEEFFADENVERSVMEKGELTDAEVAEKERDIDHSVRSSKEMAEERLEIERKAKSDGTWLKAPNGKRTNLNERQWVDVRTKNFKEWFGDWENDPENASKIVDENGEPLMVFHYTWEDFTIFGEGKEIGASTFYNASDANYAATAAIGDWFTSESDLSDDMGKPMKVFLNIKNPSNGYSLEVLADEVGTEIRAKDYEAFDEDRDNTAPIIEAGKNYQEKLRDRGYDGIFIADEEFGGTSYITFAPNQIKSAVENDGSYSPKENDIRRSVREKKEDELTDLTAEERELRDNLVERMRKGGLDVVTDSEEMQRVIDRLNERTRMMGDKQKRALETATIAAEATNNATVISSADGAKIQNNLGTLATNYEKIANKTRGFITDLSHALGLKQHESSQYGTFETPDGKRITIRVSNHNARVSNFDKNNESEGISIVISSHKNKGLHNDGNAHIIEYFYPKRALENAEGKPLAEMIRSVSDALAGEEFKDTTGLAEREEVNGSSVREHRVYHGSGADFDAFDHSHMGEGEGAQAYGWGTYVTEVEGIGRTYANATAHNYNKALRPLERKRDSIRNSLRIEALELDSARGGLRVAVKAKAKAEENYEEFLKRREEIEEKYGKHSTQYDDYLWNSPYAIAVRAIEHYENKIKERETKLHSLQKDLEETKKQIENITKVFPRHLYTVEIPDDNGSNYLDWNSSLSKEQKDTITKALKRLKVDLTYYESRGFSLDDTFADIYYFLTIALKHTRKWGGVNAIRASSKFLYSLGFTGIKYPADNMRGGRKDGAKNYVIFNENDAKITDHVRFLRTAEGEVYGLVKDGRIYLDPKVATAETAVHEYTHLWGDMLRRKDSEQWNHTVKELKNSVLWEEVKELYPELKTDDEIADEVLSTFSGRRGAERLREEARRVADGEGGVFTKAKAIETLERVKEAIARFWEGVAKMFGINRYRSAEELADMAMRDLINGVKPTSRTFTFDNFYKDTKAVFEGTERPKGKPDYISYSGSEYWYGEDKGGKYVVRGSDHWSGEFKVKDGERTNVGRNHYSEITEGGMLPIGAQGSLKFGWEKGLSKPVGSGISAAIDRRGSGDSNNIASCYWYIDNAKEKDNKGFTYGKAYLSEFEDKERRRDIPGDDWRDIQGLEGGTRAMAERIAEQPVEEINNRFNEELEKYQNNELPKGHRFELGMPSAELQSAGFPTLPISMRSSLLAKKAGAERHPFAPTDLRDLVNAIQKPIAIFNYSKNNMRNLIVDVSRGGKHFLVGVTLNYKADNIEINSVSGLFPKENHEWIKWIQDGKVLRIDQKEKVQDLINSLRTNPAESERIGLNLDDVAKKVKDFENPKLFGEEIIDDGKKGSDSTDRSVRENPKNEDKPRYSRKPGESIFDYASRVSEDVDRSVRERVSARDEYEKKVKSKGFQTKEALQNSMLGLQEFMLAIDHASGNKRYIEDIPDFENPILGENRLSSVNKEEMHQVAKTQFKPLMSAVAKLSGNGKESGELYDYMFAKHGLERDAVMRQREAQKEFDKYQKANPKGTKTIGDFVASLEGKDYAGLTALTAEDGRVKSIQSQIDTIDEQMEVTDNQLLLHYLGGQKKRLKVDLLNAARDAADDIRKAFESNPSHDRSDINELWSRVNEVNGNTLRKLYESGMLTKEAYNDISSMYTNYIPMRGFDQTTSADAYAYLTHGDSAFNAPIKTAKGRSSKADNPIAYMQAMAESAIMQGNRNVLVKQKMLNFVRNHPSDLASVSDVWLQYDSVADEWKPFYAFGRESKGGVKRQERGDIFVEYQRCKMHGTYSFWGNQPNSSDLIPRAIIIGKATI